MLLLNDCGVDGFHVQGIEHADSSLSLLSKQRFAECETIGYYYQRLVYLDAVTVFHQNGKYGEGVMAVAGTFLKKYLIPLDVEAASSCGESHNVELMPAKFCCLQCINITRYLVNRDIS